MTAGCLSAGVGEATPARETEDATPRDPGWSGIVCDNSGPRTCDGTGGADTERVSCRALNPLLHAQVWLKPPDP